MFSMVEIANNGKRSKQNSDYSTTYETNMAKTGQRNTINRGKSPPIECLQPLKQFKYFIASISREFGKFIRIVVIFTVLVINYQ